MSPFTWLVGAMLGLLLLLCLPVVERHHRHKAAEFRRREATLERHWRETDLRPPPADLMLALVSGGMMAWVATIAWALSW